MRRGLALLALLPSAVLAGCGSQSGASDDTGSTRRPWVRRPTRPLGRGATARGRPSTTRAHPRRRCGTAPWTAEMQLSCRRTAPVPAWRRVRAGSSASTWRPPSSTPARCRCSTRVPRMPRVPQVAACSSGSTAASIRVAVPAAPVFVGPDAVREVTVDGGPVVLFVATDGGMAPLAVRCGDGTIEVVTATTAEPPGVVLAWDVRRTTYTLSADGARQRGPSSLEEDVADPLLRQDMPELFDLLTAREFPPTDGSGRRDHPAGPGPLRGGEPAGRHAAVRLGRRQRRVQPDRALADRDRRLHGGRRRLHHRQTGRAVDVPGARARRQGPRRDRQPDGEPDGHARGHLPRRRGG